MDAHLALPDGFSVRPCTPDDVDAVFGMVAACEERDTGSVEIEREDIRAWWSRPTLELATDTIAVVDDATGEIVAQGEVTVGTRADACVHPERRGLGIGTWLLRWTEAHAREHDQARIGQTVPDSAVDAVNLLERNGYEWLWTSWILQIRFDERAPEPPRLPAGYALRDFVPGQDDRAVHQMIDDAFLEWSDREPETVEEWASTTIRREGFEPWLLPVVVDADDRIVGAAYLINSDAEEGWVQQLAVNRDHRSRGLGGALLAGSFRRFYERGRRVCGVNTDSRTGALGLYEHVGMSVRRTYTHRALQLNAR